MKITTAQALSAALRHARKQKGMTQAALAELAGVKQATISALETSVETSRIGTLLKVLAALELELSMSERNARPSSTIPDSETTKSGWSEEW